MRFAFPAACLLSFVCAPNLTASVAGTSFATEVGSETTTPAEWGVILNLSGKQRMLTQKMSKEVLLVALSVDQDTNLTNLKGTAELFDKTLTGLRKGDADLGLKGTDSRRVLKQLDKIDGIWAEFKPVVIAVADAGTATKEQIDTIAANNLPLLKEMNKCVKLYEKEAAKGGLKSDPELAVTINLAGKQRMLTQKLSKELLLMAYGHDVDGNKLNAIETSALFEQTLNGLIKGDETLGLPGTSDDAVKSQLEKVVELWSQYSPVVKRATASSAGELPRGDVEILARVNLPLLKEMNKAVGMFASAAK